MNRTQKTVLCNLVIMLVTILMLTYVFFQFFVLKKAPEGFSGRFLPPAVLILLGGLLIFWALKRQSPREVEADERDKLITKGAAMAAFISAWIVLPAVSVLPRFILGDDSCIPAWSLPLINIGVLLIVTVVYLATILIQYGRSGDGDK